MTSLMDFITYNEIGEHFGHSNSIGDLVLDGMVDFITIGLILSCVFLFTQQAQTYTQTQAILGGLVFAVILALTTCFLYLLRTLYHMLQNLYISITVHLYCNHI